MNREEAKKLLPIIQAYAEGKEVQINIGDVDNPEWSSVDENETVRFSDPPGRYRIKPGPKRTVGYRDYYVQEWDGAVYTCQIWEDCHNTVIEDVEQMANFIKWKHTEWQYDDVEVE